MKLQFNNIIMDEYFETLINDPQWFVNEHFYKLERQIDLHFETSNDHNNPQRFSLLDDVKRIKANVLKIFNMIKCHITKRDEIKLMLQNYSVYSFEDGKIKQMPIDCSLNCDNVLYILLQSSWLDVVNDNLFKYRRIYLSNRRLISIEADTFNKFVQIDMLHIIHNNLIKLPGTLFDKHTQLTELYLFDNNLKELTPNIFDKLTNLKILDMDQNQLTSLPNGIFNNLTKLEKLTLYQNQLIELSSNIFDSLTRLIILDISRNKLTILQPDIFYKLSSIEHLFVYNDSLRSISCEMFSNLHSLKCLYVNTSLKPYFIDNLVNKIKYVRDTH